MRIQPQVSIAMHAPSDNHESYSLGINAIKSEIHRRRTIRLIIRQGSGCVII